MEDKKEKNEALARQLEQTHDPEQRVVLLNELSYGLRQIALERSKQYAEEARLLALELNDKEQLANSLINLGSVEEQQYDFVPALKHLSEAKELFTQLGNNEKLFHCNSYLGKAYTMLGDYINALDHFYTNISLAEKMKNPQRQVHSLVNAGIIHGRLEEYDKALGLYERALTAGRAANDQRGVAFALVNLGSTYIAKDENEKGLQCFLDSAEMMKSQNDLVNYSNVIGNIGIFYSKNGKPELAEKYLLDSFRIKEEAGDHYNQISNHMHLANVYRSLKRMDLAEEHLAKGLEKMEKAGTPYTRKTVYEAMTEFYEEQKDFAKALEYYKLYYKAEKEISGEEKNRQVKSLEVKYEVDSIKQEKEIYRLRNIELANANDEISRQKTLIEQKNKDITDSINYARRIQRALLAGDALLKKNLPEFFVLYRPKDIVSGDFYWAAETENKFVLAVCDCTGHGVPGAFMSLLNISFLNEAVNQRALSQPDEVLNLVRERIIQALYDESGESGKDGMDATFCVFDFDRSELEFACANNPLWLIRDGVLHEFRPDKMPVGSYEDVSRPFTLQKQALQKGDTIYLFTDGYADQFGGPKGKKFKYTQLKELLLQIHALPMEKQKELLESAFEEWRGNLEQIDDVLVAGIRVS